MRAVRIVCYVSGMATTKTSAHDSGIEYSRDAQVWHVMSAGDLQQLSNYLHAFPFTRRRIDEQCQTLREGGTVHLFPGTDFSVWIRSEAPEWHTQR